MKHWASEGVNAELGYADRAHFARDFKSMVGKTPTEFERLR